MAYSRMQSTDSEAPLQTSRQHNILTRMRSHKNLSEPKQVCICVCARKNGYVFLTGLVLGSCR